MLMGLWRWLTRVWLWLTDLWRRAILGATASPPTAQRVQRSSHSSMYRSHPETNELALIIPSTYVQAAMNEQRVPLAVFYEMRECIQRLADLVENLQPHIVLFFATGGIPYAFPMMSVLMRRQSWDLLDGRFHMFPGLSWDGTIRDRCSSEYCISELRDLIATLRTALPHSLPVRLLALDTAHSGSGINKLVSTVNTAIRASDGTVTTDVVGIVSHAKASQQGPRDDKLKVSGSLGSVWLQKPSIYAGPQVTSAFQWLELPTSSDSHTLQLSYWVYSSIPAEDNADIMGVSSARDELGIRATSKTGRIVLATDDGVEAPLSGGRTIGDNLLNALAVPEESVVLKAIEQQFTTCLPDELQAEADEIHRSFAQVDELDHGDPDEVASQLLSARKALMPTEVYWLGSRDKLGPIWAGKLADSIRKSSHPSEYIAALRQARPDVAVGEPLCLTDDNLVVWWLEQVCK